VESGDEQSGIAGGPLPAPLVVSAFNQFDEPVAGARVEFSAPSGSFDQAVKLSGVDGKAQVVYTLGPNPGAVTIRASTLAGEVFVEFTALGEIGAAATFRAISGDQQTGLTGAALASPLRARVTNQYGVGVPGVVVDWSAQGRGLVSEAANETDGGGYAEVTFTLSPEPGPHTVTASVADFIPVTFTAVATVPPPAEPPQ
jgi:hypothetical protein